MKHRHLIVIVLLGILTFPAATTSALARDSDGSRMQARPLAVGASASDRLSPPNDAVDWRYIRLAAAEDVTLTVDTTPANAVVDVTLTDAMGKSIARGKSSGGTYTSRRRLDPGLYYIAVSSSADVAYRIAVQ